MIKAKGKTSIKNPKSTGTHIMVQISPIKDRMLTVTLDLNDSKKSFLMLSAIK